MSKEYKIHAKLKPGRPYPITDTLCRQRFTQPCTENRDEVTCSTCISLLIKRDEAIAKNAAEKALRDAEHQAYWAAKEKEGK